MRIAAGVQFFGLSVFLHSIELIRSQPQPELAEPTTLKLLFPQSDGIHFPPIEEIKHTSAQSFPKFQILNGRQMVEPVATYLKRGDVIFGYEEGDDIKLLGRLFHEPYLLAVFNTKNQRWYTLPFPELEKLGATRSLRLVRVHDEISVATHSQHDEANPQAHYAASEAAYLATRWHEEPLRIPLFGHEEGATSVKEYYAQKYNEEYERHAGGPSEGR